MTRRSRATGSGHSEQDKRKRILKIAMAFKKGQSGNPAGKPKGPNKATVEFRDTVRRLLEDNSANVGRWLTMVAEGDGTDSSKPDPAKALDLLAKLAEFAAPKLNRTEHVGDGGGPVKQSITVEFK